MANTAAPKTSALQAAFVVAATLFAGTPALAGALHVLITGFESSEGELAIALFGNEDDYESQENAIERAWLPVVDGRAEWRLPSVPAGEYAVIAYHDTNGNRQIDFRLLGMPKEPVGVSNNARGAFGPPRFKAASFAIPEEGVARQHLRLR